MRDLTCVKLIQYLYISLKLIAPMEEKMLHIFVKKYMIYYIL